MGPSNREAVIEMYARRARSYDDADPMSVFHARFGRDFVRWAEPKNGDKALDLACGTGLVTFPLANKVGPDGVVIGVDVTPEMLEVAHEKFLSDPEHLPTASASVELLEADISSNSLKDLPSIRSVLNQGGFDVITCCSALILLPDPVAAIKLWSSMLRKGGTIVVDVPTEYRSIQYLLTDTLWTSLGMTKTFDRAWIKGKHTLEDALQLAGLEIVHSWESYSATPVRAFAGDENTGRQVFEKEISRYRQYDDEDIRERALALWPQIWKSAATDGEVVDQHTLYVCIGKKS